MTDREAIVKANELRPNDIPDETKAEWLQDVELEFAELMGVEVPISNYPEETELLLPDPKSLYYVRYLAAMIDDYNQETSLYANDSTMANRLRDEARAWWRRNNMPKQRRIKL